MWQHRIENDCCQSRRKILDVPSPSAACGIAVSVAGCRVYAVAAPIERRIGNFSPKPVEITERVLNDDVWERKELSQRSHSLTTAAAPIRLNRWRDARHATGIRGIGSSIRE